MNNGCFGFEKEKTINFQIAEGDKVFSHLTYEGVFDKGQIYVYPPNGKKVRFNALYAVRFENGLIVEIWVTLEGATILHQIGAVKLI
jgi:predicted ester cyclase